MNSNERTPLLHPTTSYGLPTSPDDEDTATFSGEKTSTLSGPTKTLLVEAHSNDFSENSDLYHCHDDRIMSAFDYKARRTLILASMLCLLFMLAEIVGGLWAGSLAIITDAAHLLTDFASFLISLFSLYMASRPASQRMSFGWHRAEVIGAFLSVLLIWVVTGILVYIAIQRIITKEYEIDAVIMLVTAGVGVAVNIIMGLLLHFGGGHGHSHGGGSSHSHASHAHSDDSNSQRQRNINVRAALIHVIGDLVQSIGVFIAALLIYFMPGWAIADPICTFIFSILVLITTVAIMRDALNVLMEGKPRGIDFGEVIKSLHNIEGVRKVHDLRIWSLTMDKVALSVHLAIAPETNAQAVLRTTTAMLRKRYGVHECTVQIESYSDSMIACGQCEPPL
uniref:Zinc transporter 2 n=1 Tax=Plectus sambesii TaxID=2011161 RepID=A0A914UGL3_9BILA